MNDPLPAPVAPKRGRRWKKILFVGVLLLVVLILLAPLLLAPVVKGMVVSVLEEKLDAEASIESLSFSLAGSMRVAGLELTDPTGAPLARVDELSASVGVLGLLHGSYDADVELHGFEVHVRKDAAGDWNLAKLQRPSAPEEDKVESEPSPLPKLAAKLHVDGGRIVVHGGERGDTRFEALSLSADVTGLDQPAPFRASFDVVGPNGPAGGLVVEGSATAAADGRLGLTGLRATARLALNDIVLAGLAPAVALATPVQGIDGRLSGTAELELGAHFALEGSSAIELAELALVGTREGAPSVRVTSVRLDGRAVQAGDGSGTQELTLRADEFLALAYAGTSNVSTAGDGSLTGTFSLDGSLARLVEIAGAWLPIQEGVAVAGTLAGKLALGATLTGGSPSTAQVKLEGGLTGLSARDAGGKELDLGDLTSVQASLDAELDLARGILDAPAFALHAGPIQISGHAQVGGLPNGPDAGVLALSDAAFHAEANLTELRTSVAKLVDLGALRFGGSFTADGTASGGADAQTVDLGFALRDIELEHGALGKGPLALAHGDGRLKLEKGPGRELAASASIQLAKITLPAPEGAEPGAPLASATMTGSLTVDEQGRAVVNARLQAERALTLELQGIASNLPPEKGELGATITLQGDVGRLAAMARPWAKLEKGLELAGSLGGTSEIEVEWSAGVPTLVDAQASLELADLAAKDAEGKSLDLGTLTKVSFACAGKLDIEQGSAALSKLELTAGPVRASGHGRVDGLPLGASTAARKLAIQESQLSFEADLDLLSQAIAPLFDLGGLAFGGKLAGSATASGGAERSSLSAKADIRGLRAAGGALGDPGVKLDGLTFAAEASYDADSDSLELSELVVDGDFVHARGSGSVAELSEGAARRIELTLATKLAPLAASERLAGFLGGMSLSGGEIEGTLELAQGPSSLEARGSLGGAELVVARPDNAPLTQRDFALEFDVLRDGASGSLELRKAEFRSQTARASASGTIADLATPSQSRADLELSFGGELARILGDLGLEEPDGGRSTRGALSGTGTLAGEKGNFHLTAGASVESFRLEIAPASPQEKPVVIEDPKIEISCDATIALEKLDVVLTELGLDSRLAHGTIRGKITNLGALGSPEAADEIRFEGLVGELGYIPDHVGLVLAPWLPGKLSGAAEEKVSFAFDGRAKDFDVATIIAHTNGTASLGIGRFVRPEIDAAGTLALDMQDGRAGVKGDLKANGGTLVIDGMLDLSAPVKGEPPPRTAFSFELKEFKANSALAPLLSFVHPAFGAASSLQATELGGLVNATLELEYDGPLTLEQIEKGWQELPKQPIGGKGRFELKSAALSSSPLLLLLRELGLDATKSLDLKPIDFTITKGRLSYGKPWTWTISGVAAQFSGSIGLDETLDLAISLPITPGLVERYSALAILEGSSIDVPIRGTVRAPKLAFDGLLKDLLVKAGKKELERRLLGGGAKKDGEGGGTPATSNDPDALLKEADRLWGEGKKVEAAAIYMRLRDDFKLSLTYVLNKDRIRDRAKFKPE